MKPPFDLHRGRYTGSEWDRHRAAFRLYRHPRRRGFGWPAWAGMMLAGIAGGAAWTMLPAGSAAAPAPSARVEAASSPDRSAARARFTLCHSGGGVNCVVDGDTFRVGGVRIRIADIDAPETHPSRCAREAELGRAATRRLRTLLNAGAVSLEPIGRDADRFGRKLRLVSVDGRGVGQALVAEGLARRYAGGYREGWCG